MNKDATAKKMDEGAKSAAIANDMEPGLPEATKPRGAPDDKTTGSSVFDAKGAIGKHFTTDGAIGGTAQKVGGPFDKDGSIGKAFTTKGSIGGTLQDKLGKGDGNTFKDL